MFESSRQNSTGMQRTQSDAASNDRPKEQSPPTSRNAQALERRHEMSRPVPARQRRSAAVCGAGRSEESPHRVIAQECRAHPKLTAVGRGNGVEM